MIISSKQKNNVETQKMNMKFLVFLQNDIYSQKPTFKKHFLK